MLAVTAWTTRYLKIVLSGHTAHLCLAYISQNKQGLLLCTESTDWLMCLLRGTNWVCKSNRLHFVL